MTPRIRTKRATPRPQPVRAAPSVCRRWGAVVGVLWGAVALVPGVQAQGLGFEQVIKDVGVVDGLDGARSPAMSPDGAHVYTASFGDDAVAVFSRNAVTGSLTFVEMQQGGVGGVDGLREASSVTVSPDGEHVYATGSLDNAVTVFSRNAVTGSLTFVEVKKDSFDGVDGIKGARSVTVSPDGEHVYATGSLDNAVAAFSRNATTGALTFVEVQKDGIAGVDGLEGAWSVTVSPDGAHVYVASLSDDAVAVFSRNAATGQLSFVEVQKDGIASVDGIDGAVSVTVSPNGEHVYVAGDIDDAVAVFSRNAVTGHLDFVEVLKDGVDGVDGLNGAFSVRVSGDGNHVYVAGNDDHAVAVFSRNDTTGELTFVEAIFDGANGVDGLIRCSGVTVSPDGEHVYTTAAHDDAVAVFSRDATTGELAFVEAIFDGAGGVDGLEGAFSVTVSSDGAHVYAAGSLDDAVAVFKRNTATGFLTFVEMQKDSFDGVDGLEGARSVTVSPDGEHVYATGSLDNAVAAFSRNATTGALTFVEVQKDGIAGVDGLEGAWSVTVSPDGEHVYVASLSDNAVAVFSRNAATGQLSFVEVQQDGVGGIDGLDGALSVTVSPDGEHVYAAGLNDNAVVVFSRNAITGALTFVEIQKDGLAGVDGLEGAAAVTVSPDGEHVYVAGIIDDAVAVFSRNTTTGQLTFVEVHKDGIAGVDGLEGAASVTVSPDGEHVYAAGTLDDAVAVFSRNATTGALTFVEVQQDGTGDVDGLDGAASVTISPDDDHLYAASQHDDALAVFRVLVSRVRFVATTGSDAGNNCRQAASPCATVAHAVGQANDGDRLDIAAGVYIEPGLVIDKDLFIVGAGVVVR